jgi:hypothetical protein
MTDMGFDEMRDKAADLAGEHGDKVEEGIDRAESSHGL